MISQDQALQGYRRVLTGNRAEMVVKVEELDKKGARPYLLSVIPVLSSAPLLAGKGSRSEKLARTSISLPASLKRQMENVDVNWRAFVREAIMQRLTHEDERDVAEAVLINEKLRRKPSKGWDSTRMIRYWRSRRS